MKVGEAMGIAKREREDAWVASLAALVPKVDRERGGEMDVDALLMCSLIDGNTTLGDLSEFLATPLSVLVNRLRPLVASGFVKCPGFNGPSSGVHSLRPSLRPTTPVPPTADALAICRGACEKRTLAEGENPWLS